MVPVLALRSAATRCDPRRRQRGLHGGGTQAAYGMGCGAGWCNGLDGGFAVDLAFLWIYVVDDVYL